VSERKWGRAIFGGLIGLALGVVLGVHRVTESVVEESGGRTEVVDFSFVIHSPRFWIVLVICTVVLAFISGRIGRSTSHSDL
jgi:prolipoprotein diacylglyceryltransferase